MTDLVKRATPSADELHDRRVPRRARRASSDSSRWLRPGAICFVGLARLPRRGRPARAARACSPSGFGGVPAYVMPNPSGLNAHATPRELAEHLRAAARLADDATVSGAARFGEIRFARRKPAHSWRQRSGAARQLVPTSARRFSIVVNASWNDPANDVDALALERGGHVVEVDAGRGEVGHHLVRLVDVLGRRCPARWSPSPRCSASIDAGASVFTVSGPMSSST